MKGVTSKAVSSKEVRLKRWSAVDAVKSKKAKV